MDTRQASEAASAALARASGEMDKAAQAIAVATLGAYAIGGGEAVWRLFSEMRVEAMEGAIASSVKSALAGSDEGQAVKFALVEWALRVLPSPQVHSARRDLAAPGLDWRDFVLNERMFNLVKDGFDASGDLSGVVLGAGVGTAMGMLELADAQGRTPDRMQALIAFASAWLAWKHSLMPGGERHAALLSALNEAWERPGEVIARVEARARMEREQREEQQRYADEIAAAAKRRERVGCLGGLAFVVVGLLVAGHWCSRPKPTGHVELSVLPPPPPPTPPPPEAAGLWRSSGGLDVLVEEVANGLRFRCATCSFHPTAAGEAAGDTWLEPTGDWTVSGKRLFLSQFVCVDVPREIGWSATARDSCCRRVSTDTDGRIGVWFDLQGGHAKVVAAARILAKKKHIVVRQNVVLRCKLPKAPEVAVEETWLRRL